jgi:hypothetical protein
MIKKKTGKCCDCGKETILCDGRCNYHYWRHRDAEGAAKRKAKGITSDAYGDKRAVDRWFQEQINQMPDRCEECNERLYNYAPHALRSFVAHVVPKRKVYGCPSVKMHPMNRLFLCTPCHTNYDTWGADKVTQMNCYRLAVERFLLLCGAIAEQEWKNVPGHLIDASYEQLNKG